MSEDAPQKRRFRPVIEEIVQDQPLEAPVMPPVPPSHTNHNHPHTHHHHVSSEEKQKQNLPDDLKEKLFQLGIEGDKVDRESSASGFNLAFFAIVLVVAILVSLASGALYVYFSGIKATSATTPTPLATSPSGADFTPLPVVSTSPTPLGTPKATANPKSYKISILNGSGKIGEAGNVKTLLQDAGFTVSQTGNAESFNFTQTLIEAKEAIPAEIVQAINDALKSSYQTKIGGTLSDKSSFDVIVTVGSK